MLYRMQARFTLLFVMSPFYITPPTRDIRISNQFLITRALHFAQLRQAYYQAIVTITLGRRV